jgi:hypothetical protein
MTSPSPLLLLAVFTVACATSPTPDAEPVGVEGGRSADGEYSTTATPLDEKACGALLAIDPQQAPYRPVLPARILDGSVHTGRYRVDVTAKGKVFAVEVVERPARKEADGAFVFALFNWRYRPHLVDGKPVHFSCPVRLDAR